MSPRGGSQSAILEESDRKVSGKVKLTGKDSVWLVAFEHRIWAYQKGWEKFFQTETDASYLYGYLVVLSHIVFYIPHKIIKILKAEVLE